MLASASLSAFDRTGRLIQRRRSRGIDSGRERGSGLPSAHRRDRSDRPLVVWSRGTYGVCGASAPYEGVSGTRVVFRRRGRASCISKSRTNLSSTSSLVAPPNCSMTAFDGSNAATTFDGSNGTGGSAAADTGIGTGTGEGAGAGCTFGATGTLGTLDLASAATCVGVISRPITGASAACAATVFGTAGFFATGFATEVTFLTGMERSCRNQKY